MGIGDLNEFLEWERLEFKQHHDVLRNMGAGNQGPRPSQFSIPEVVVPMVCVEGELAPEAWKLDEGLACLSTCI